MTTPIRPTIPFTEAAGITQPTRPSETPQPPDWSQGPTRALAKAQRLARLSSPERAAKIAALQRTTGYTSAFIADHFDELTAATKEPGFDPAAFVRESPLAAAWLAEEPNRVALMGKDLTKMGAVERIVRDAGAKFGQGMRQVELSRIGSAVLAGTVTPVQRERQRRIEVEQRLAPDYGNTSFLSGAIPAAAEQLPIYARSLVAAGGGAVVGAGVGAVVGGALGKTPGSAATGARFGSKVGAGANLYRANAEMEAAFAVLDYERMVDANGQRLDAETARGAALISGAVAGALESVADVAGAKLIPGVRGLVADVLRNPTTREIFGRYAKNVAQQMATEGATEMLQKVITTVGGQLAVAGQDGTLDAGRVAAILTDADTWGEAIAEGRVGAQAALVLGGGAGAATVIADVRRVQRAERGAEAIRALAENVQDMNATQAAPEEVVSLFTGLAQSGLDAITYNADDFRAFWSTVTDANGGNVDPREVVRELLGTTTQYDAAIETGGTFDIPVGPWAVQLMRNEAVRQWAVDNAKVGRDALSKAEAERLVPELERLMAEAETAQAEAPDVVRSLSTAIERAMVDRLQAVGRTEREAQSSATMWAAMYRSLATRSGTDPQMVARQFARILVRGPEAVEAKEASRMVAEMIAEVEAMDATVTESERTVTDVPPVEVDATAAAVQENEMMRQAEREGLAMDAENDAVRTPSGRLVSNLERVSTLALTRELAKLYDANASEQTMATARETNAGDTVVVGNAGTMRASGRVAARNKTVAKLEAELARRGVDAAQAVVDYMANPNDDPTSFHFGENVDALWQAAFHGSPHIFDKFTTARMGTGEGAQAYGWGLYFAEDVGVAEGYRKALETTETLVDGNVILPSDERFDAAIRISILGFDAALQDAERDAGSKFLTDQGKASAARRASAIRSLRGAKVTQRKSGSLYRVDISDDAVVTFLDWDRQITSDVVALIRKAMPADELERTEDALNESVDEWGGDYAYKALSRYASENALPGDDFGVSRGDEAASKYLLRNGIHGIKYLDAGSRGQGWLLETLNENGDVVATERHSTEGAARASVSRFLPAERQRVREDVTRNLVVFDENDVTITHRNGTPVTAQERTDFLEQNTADTTRGGLVVPFSEDAGFRLPEGLGPVDLMLFEKADQSTFIHEAAHFYLLLAKDLLDAPEASAEFRADMTTLYGWLGASPGAALTREQEEQFARGFEEYLRTNEAPSLELRNAFRLFRGWLKRIYKTVKALVTLTPEVVRFYDRMIATDAEIAAADEAMGPGPLFPDDPAIERARVEAVLAAREVLSAETMGVVYREEEAWYKAQHDAKSAEIAAALNADPAYRARSILLSGKTPDGTVPEGGNPIPGKLDKASVAAILGADNAKAFSLYYRVAGGMDVTAAAGLFGYDSATAFLADLGATVPVKEHIRTLADQAMREEYGDPLTDGTVEEKAAQALHNTAREKLIRLQLEKMQQMHPAQVRAALRKYGGRVPSTAQMQMQAEVMLRGRPLNTLRRGVEFQRAEVKASRDAIRYATAGDWENAAAAKFREALSHALYRQAQTALDMVEKSKARFQRAFAPDADIGKTRDLNYVNAARAVLASVGYGKADQPPLAYLASVEKYDPEAYADLRAILDAVPISRPEFETLTIAEVEAVREVFEALWGRAKGDREIEVGGVKMQIDDAMAMVVDRLDALPGSIVANARVEGMSEGWDMLYSGTALLARMETLVSVLDGGDINGPFRRTFWDGTVAATTAMREQMTTLYAKYLSIVQGLEGLTDAKIPAPMLRTPDANGRAVPYEWRGKAHLLGAMLHVGNASNKDKLLRGMGWDAGDWDMMVAAYHANGTLTKADYDALQGVWDLFESIKPQAQQVFKKLHGHYFAEITADPVVTPFGVYRGGYVPAMRDPSLVEDAAARQQDRELESGITPESMPSTGRGFTYGRNDSASPLLMDFTIIGVHLDAVMRFVHLEPVVRPLARLVRRPQFKEAMNRVYPKGTTRLFNPWLMRVARQRTITRGKWDALDRATMRLRRTATGNALFGNVANALQNIVGVFPLAAKLNTDGYAAGRAIAAAARAFAMNRKGTIEAITQASPWMRQHSADQMLELVRDIRNTIEPATPYRTFRDFAQAHGFAMSKTTQYAIDFIAWQAGYEAATRGNVAHEDAVRYADSVVRTSQSSSNPEDVANYAEGSPFYQMIIAWSSYFNAQANLNVGGATAIVQSVGLKAGAAKLFYLYLFGVALPATMGDAVVRVMNQDGITDDDDEDMELADVLRWLATSQARYVTAMVPGLGPNLMAVPNAFNDKPYDDRITVSPMLGTVESSVRGVREVGLQVFTDEEIQKRDIRDLFTLFSLATDLPVGFAYRPATYLFEVNEGTARPGGVIDFTRGLVSGRR